MTIKEAREILNPEHREHYDSIEIVEEACRMGMNALEKQIPKKPISLPDGHPFYYEIHDCPFCEESVYVAEGGFCPSCGQALDWSDNDD